MIGRGTAALIITAIGAMIAVVAFIVFVEGGQRRIPVQYAKRVIGRKVVGMLRVIVQALSDRRDRFRHVNLLAFPCSLSKYTAHRTYFQELNQGLQPQSPYPALCEAWLAAG